MKYRVATTPEDFAECYALLRAEKWPPQELGHPTLMGHNAEGVFVGFISTELQDGMVIAGPMVVKQDKKRPISVLNLMTAYEEVLMSMGIKRFIFWVDSEKTPGFVRGLKKYIPDMKPYATQGTKEFYVRVLNVHDINASVN